ncbi:MAG: hypothetical protein Q4A11_05340 [Brachymonas sp.]|nr:hypothetical protein [Brachymonas sp.]
MQITAIPLWLMALGLIGIALSTAHIWVHLRIMALRAKGVYPQAGHASDTDVMRLLQNGHRILAMRCYREVHGCSLREAQAAVAKWAADASRSE